MYAEWHWGRFFFEHFSFLANCHFTNAAFSYLPTSTGAIGTFEAPLPENSVSLHPPKDIRVGIRSA
jgi:hypothetical protein